MDRHTTLFSVKQCKIIIWIDRQVARYERAYHHKPGYGAALVDQMMSVAISSLEPYGHAGVTPPIVNTSTKS